VASAAWRKPGQHTRGSNSPRIIDRCEAKSLDNPANEIQAFGLS
jgi:hypothetical protein